MQATASIPETLVRPIRPGTDIVDRLIVALILRLLNGAN